MRGVTSGKERTNICISFPLSSSWTLRFLIGRAAGGCEATGGLAGDTGVSV